MKEKNEKSVELQIKELILPVAEKMGVKVRKVEWQREKRGNFLRIFIDKEGGVSINDCTAFSREISPLLDRENIINERYYLEVSSPGLDREIFIPEELPEVIGKKLKVTLKSPVEGIKIIAGILKSYREESIVLEDTKHSKSWQIAIKNIEKINLEPEI